MNKKELKPEDRSGLLFDCEYIVATKGKKWALKYLDMIDARPCLGTNQKLMEDAIEYRQRLRNYIKSI
jgi:hypothetical protein